MRWFFIYLAGAHAAFASAVMAGAAHAPTFFTVSTSLCLAVMFFLEARRW